MSECNYTYDIDFLKEICARFGIEGEIDCVRPLTQGHINKTYDIAYKSKRKIERYILQYVNSYVFKNPQAVMENTALVTKHIKAKMEESGVDTKRQVLNFFEADGKNYYIDKNGDFWRLRINVENSISYSQTDNLYIIEEAGRAFGNFQKYLADFDAKRLNIVIPHFHNTKRRYLMLENAVKKDAVSRLKNAREEYIEFLKLKDIAVTMHKMKKKGELPLRATHNDTKINNVLFDKDNYTHLAVIDLDTLMPGLIGFDYGDAIRFTANAAAEDEENLGKVYLDFDKFTAFTKGFVEKTKDIMSIAEFETLALGGVTMAIECGVRFLTDYLEGDKYFCIDYPEHNLVRCRCQLKLAKNMIDNYDKMKKIINTYK